MGDALFVHGGVTSALEARLALAGLLALQGPGALDVRTGVLHGPGTTSLVAGTTATAPMTVTIGTHDAVTSRGVANGPYLMPTETVQTVPIGAAPGSGTRTDVVYVKQQDNTPGIPTPDGATGPLYGVQAGTVGAGKPSIAGIVGAEEVATVAVSAGATNTLSGSVVITQTAKLTAARGAPIPVRSQAERDALTPFWPLLTVNRLDTGNIEVRNAANNGWLTLTTSTALAAAIAAGVTAPTPTLFPGAANWGVVTGYARPGYYRDTAGVVHGSGAIQWTGGAVGAGTPLSTALPAAFRPNAPLPLQIMGSAGSGVLRVDLSTAGVLTVLSNLAAGTVLFLDSLVYNPETLTAG